MGIFERSFAAVVAALFFFGGLGLAQQTSAAPAQENSQTAKPGSTEEQNSIEFLQRRSTFFPDLATKPGPLSTAEKFKLALSNSVSGYAFTRAALGAGFSQAIDSNSGYGQGAAGYGKRFGSSMATNASINIFGTWLLASALHQDPRFFVRARLNFGQSLVYSAKCVLITPTDRGSHAFNWSGLGGTIIAEGIANSYLPSDQRTAARTFGRAGIDAALRVGGNLFRQYWPRINKKLLTPKDAKKSGSPATEPGKTSQP